MQDRFKFKISQWAMIDKGKSLVYSGINESAPQYVSLSCDNFISPRLEIISNVHENAELLEE